MDCETPGKRNEPTGITSAEKRKHKKQKLLADRKYIFYITKYFGVDETVLAYNVKAASPKFDKKVSRMPSELFQGVNNELECTKILNSQAHGGYDPTPRVDTNIAFPLSLMTGRTHMTDDEAPLLTERFLNSVVRAKEKFQNENVQFIHADKHCNESEEDEIINLVVSHE